ncbi:MAG: sucrase ferredoxin [Ardenticatenaceae bacterium]|nr:sucrase ferredoxin [Ardenticatenaceae bacterium]
MLPPPNFLCCELSAALNEPMAGTAVTTAIWYLLEYTRPWGAKATEENELPGDILKWLGDQVSGRNGRLQLIRQFRPDADVLAFFVGVNDQAQPRLYEFHLGAYADLRELDVAAVVRGDGRYAPHLVTGPRYFVCTNGKRDRSCAVYGAALYRALAEKVGNAAWMTTHLGGHRFAGTLLALPAGVCYGRVAPADVPHLLATTQRGHVWLERLRGRTCYGPVEQVADFYARQELGLVRLDALQWVDTAVTETGWLVQFVSGDGRAVQVALSPAPPLAVYANSGQLKLKEMAQYKLDKVTE